MEGTVFRHTEKEINIYGTKHRNFSNTPNPIFPMKLSSFYQTDYERSASCDGPSTCHKAGHNSFVQQSGILCI